MSNGNTNQAAYPLPAQYNKDGGFLSSTHYGLTKREVFAMAAMQGLLTNDRWTGDSHESLAKSAILYADALLTELGS